MYKENELFVILYGLNGHYYFMSENTDFARLYMRKWIIENDYKGIFTLYKVDKKSFLNDKKVKKSFVDYIERMPEDIREIKEKTEKAAREKYNAEQIKMLFGGRYVE